MHGYRTNYRFSHPDLKLHESFALASLKEEKYFKIESILSFLKNPDLINEDNPFAAGCFNAITILSADYSAELDRSRLTWTDNVTI